MSRAPVANGAGTAAMLERRQLRLPGAWFNWWPSSSGLVDWVSLSVELTLTVLAVLPGVRHHHQRSRCASRSLVGSYGLQPQNYRARVRSAPAVSLWSSLSSWNLLRAALVLCEDGQWWAANACSRGARWSVMLLQICRTRFLAMVWQGSAARSNALGELDTLHASDQYDLMRGVRRS